MGDGERQEADRDRACPEGGIAGRRSRPGPRVAGAAARVALGLASGLLLAEVLVRVAGLGPTAVPSPRTVENEGKTAALDCYPDGRAEQAEIDLRDPAARATEEARSGLDGAHLAGLAATTPFCMRLAYNEHTRRDIPFAPAAAGEMTVLVVGDSFVEGQGVGASETLPARLGTLLHALPPVRVLNGGRRGLDQPDLALGLPELLAAVRPDVVVYAMTLNDFEQDPAWAARQQYLNDLILDRQHMDRPTWKLPGPLRRSALAVLAAERLRSRRATAQTIDWYLGMAGPGNAGGWARTRDDLASMQAACDASSARLLVAILPMLVGLDGDGGGYPFLPLHSALAQACDELGIEHIDLLPALLGQPAEDLRVHRVDLHPNARACLALARALAPRVEAIAGEMATEPSTVVPPPSPGP